MSEVRISNELFLGTIELKRLFSFLGEEGFRKLMRLNTASFGVLQNTLENNPAETIGTYFKLEQGSGVSTLKCTNDSYALDKNLQLISKKAFDNLPIPDDGNWYYIRISYLPQIYEEGRVTVDSNGNMTGVGSKFLQVLRGQPDFPSKIRFYDDIGGVGLSEEYEVLEVIDDLNVILQGDFSATSIINLRYQIVGTFTPGYPVPTEDKGIFSFDDCSIDLIAGNEPVKQPDSTYTFDFPAVPEDGLYFYVAAVLGGSTVTIADSRYFYMYKTWITAESRYFARIANLNNFFSDFYNWKVGTYSDFITASGTLVLNHDGNIFSVTAPDNSVIKDIVGTKAFMPDSMIFLRLSASGGTVKFAKVSAGGKFYNFPDRYADTNATGSWFLLKKMSSEDKWEMISYDKFISDESSSFNDKLTNIEGAWSQMSGADILAGVGMDSGFALRFTSVGAGHYHYKLVGKTLTLNVDLDMRTNTESGFNSLFIKLPGTLKVAVGKNFRALGEYRTKSSDPSNSNTYLVEVVASGNTGYLQLKPFVAFLGNPVTIKHNQDAFNAGLATSEAAEPTIITFQITLETY